MLWSLWVLVEGWEGPLATDPHSAVRFSKKAPILKTWTTRAPSTTKDHFTALDLSIVIDLSTTEGLLFIILDNSILQQLLPLLLTAFIRDPFTIDRYNKKDHYTDYIWSTIFGLLYIILDYSILQQLLPLQLTASSKDPLTKDHYKKKDHYTSYFILSLCQIVWLQKIFQLFLIYHTIDRATSLEPSPANDNSNILDQPTGTGTPTTYYIDHSPATWVLKFDSIYTSRYPPSIWCPG